MMRLDRYEKNEEVLVDVIECSDDALIATSMACRTVDVSEEGMKVALGMPVPISSRLGLRLDFTDSLYRLEGEVRWFNQDGYVGLELDEDSPDFVNWIRMFELDLM